jgi:hypothetical protein
MPQLREILDKINVQFPVLHYMDGDEGGFFDYNIEYFGYNLLVDPQGVIFNNIWVREDLPEIIARLESAGTGIPRLAASVTGFRSEDGTFITRAAVSSSSHEPIELKYGGWYEYQGREQEMEYLYGEEKYSSRQLKFGEFGDYTFELEYPAREGLERFYAWVSMDYPGTENLYDDDCISCTADLNIWINEDGTIDK